MSAPCPALGFDVELVSREDLARDRLARFRAEWALFLARRGLRGREYHVGSEIRLEVASEASQATQNDRAAVESWLAAWTDLGRWRVGDIRDLRPDE